MHHIIASFHLATDIERPKRNGIRSGYAPHHKFATVDWLASGVHAYADDRLHYPGETLRTRIAFVSWEHLTAHVQVGDKFDVMESDRLVGQGCVEEILNSVRSGNRA